jgi:hypothetical protein
MMFQQVLPMQLFLYVLGLSQLDAPPGILPTQANPILRLKKIAYGKEKSIAFVPAHVTLKGTIDSA